jgi:hypothetical protein
MYVCYKIWKIKTKRVASCHQTFIFTFPQAWNDEEEKREKNHPVAEVIQKTA